MPPNPPSIQDATRAFKHWLGHHLTLSAADLALKHRRMAANPFDFMRATFYRFAQRWADLAGEAAGAPRVLAVGDLHVENFGTWRDAEGRLAWGVNDFDEAARLPYTLDLARLALSARLAGEAGLLALDRTHAADALLAGYRAGMEAGGRPFILEERHAWLRDLVRPDPARFWTKLQAWPSLERPGPEAAVLLLRRALPAGARPRYAHRVAGLGSLGRVRLLALAEWQGGLLAREVKALAPSAVGWALGRAGGRPLAASAARRAIRSPDPHLRFAGGFVVRRLAPSSTRIDLAELSRAHHADLLEAMGFETANVHLGNLTEARTVLADLDRRPAHWLIDLTDRCAEATVQDWQAWKKS